MTRLLLVVVLLLAGHFTTTQAQDTIEFLNGTNMPCTILEIRKADKEFDVEVQVGKSTIQQTFPYSQVHAVTFQGKRFELNAKPVSTEMDAATAHTTRTRQEVLKLIDNAGRTPPDWYASTALNVPDTLDLDWPLKPPEGWNNKENVGQYIWDIINPNEQRWRAGIKLVHQCLERHKSNPALLKRDMDKLGTMYFTLLQDYPRAAFWLQQAGTKVGEPAGVHLAECYWRLGNREMAMALLKANALPVTAVKLFGDLGEIDLALRLAEAYSKTQAADQAFLAAGDALRKAQRPEEAIAYYRRVLESSNARNKEYEARFAARAQESIEAIELFDKADVSQVADGTYSSSSTGYNGPLKIAVKLAGGKIVSLTVTDHQEKQFYAALTDTPKQIIDTQGVRDIDGTSGATITSQAITNATAKALAQGAQ